MRAIVKLIVLCIIIALGFLAWHYFYPSQTSDQTKSAGSKKGVTMPVGVATVKTGSIDVYLSGLGNVTPRSTVTVHTRVDGQLMRVLFHEGQLVKSGDLLAELDARPYEAQLKQAQGLLLRDQALLAEAKIDLQRYKTLYAQDSIAKQQLDLQGSLVKQYEGAVKNDQGTIDAAEVQIIYTKITSPVSGRVGLRQVDPGNIVHATDTNGIVIVTELQPITVIFTVPEDNIPTVMQHTQSGKKLLTEAWDRDSKTKLAAGSLVAVDNAVDPTTGTVKLRCEFPNKDNALFPSQFVNVKLRLDTKKNVVLMSTAGIQRGTKGTFVYLVKPDKSVSVQPITLGISEGDVVEVVSGLKEGDQIVIDGTDSLRDGAKVEIASADGKPVAAATADKKSQDAQDDSTHHKHKKHADNE